MERMRAMSNLIERYVYDVTRRLPQADREEVGRELRSNIFDMLPDEPDQGEIEAVLLSLGAPARLAEQYRPRPRYLISPAVYDSYTKLLGLVLPIVGSVLMVLGAVMGSLEAAKLPAADAVRVISLGVSSGVSMAFEGALQALFWITLGFAIADRYRDQQGKTETWSLSDLPEIPADEASGISLTESIVELGLTALFGTLGILFCLGVLPFVFALRLEQIQVNTLFAPGFLRSCVPVVAVTAGLGLVESALKIYYRRWTVPVCAGVLVSGLANVAGLFYLAGRPEIFSRELSALLDSTIGRDLAFLSQLGSRGFNLLHLVLVVVVVATVFECASAVYKTVKSQRA